METTEASGCGYCQSGDAVPIGKSGGLNICAGAPWGTWTWRTTRSRAPDAP